MPVYKSESRLDSGESIAMNIRLLDLMKKTSYRILQVNGQRRYGGPPPEWTGPPPPKDSEVFVGKIPRNCFEDELVPVFSQVGKIYELRLMMDFSGTNRGYAFVMYTSPSEAEKAVTLLNDYEIRPGRNIGVVRSTNNCKIYIGTLSGNIDGKMIKKTIKNLTEGVVDVKIHVVPGAKKRTLSRKPHFVIAEYESHRAAAMARRRLLPARLELWGHEVSVEWANTVQRLSSNGQMSNLRSNGNRHRLVKSGDDGQVWRPTSELACVDSKLINGKTLEEAMDAMLYGPTDQSIDSSLVGKGSSCTQMSESYISESDMSFTFSSGLELFTGCELSDKISNSNGSDDSFPDGSSDENGHYNVDVGFFTESCMFSRDEFNANKPVQLTDDISEKLSEMNVTSQYQLFDYNCHPDKSIANNIFTIQDRNIQGLRILESCGSQLSNNYSLIGFTPGHLLFNSFESDSGYLPTYPLF